LQPVREGFALHLPLRHLGEGARRRQCAAQAQGRQPRAAAEAGGRRGDRRARRQRTHPDPRQPARRHRHREEGRAAGHGRQVRTLERTGPPRADRDAAGGRRLRRRTGWTAIVSGGAAGSRAAHLPVMFEQVMEGLRVVEDGNYLDGTFGRGGHARGVLERLGEGGRLLLMDKDPEAIAVAEREFGTDARVAIRRGSFADLGRWDAVADGLDGVLLDLGVSSPQLDVAGRGLLYLGATLTGMFLIKALSALIPIVAIISFIDAVILFSMSKMDFNLKYNTVQVPQTHVE